MRRWNSSAGVADRETARGIHKGDGMKFLKIVPNRFSSGAGNGPKDFRDVRAHNKRARSRRVFRHSRRNPVAPRTRVTPRRGSFPFRPSLHRLLPCRPSRFPFPFSSFSRRIRDPVPIDDVGFRRTNCARCRVRNEKIRAPRTTTEKRRRRRKKKETERSVGIKKVHHKNSGKK